MTEHDPWTLSPKQRRELLASLSDDYVLGYELGVHVSWNEAWSAGWDAAEQDMASAWAKVAKEVRDRANDRPAAELRALRDAEPDHQPCPRKCDACSRCIHSRAWYSRGKQPYLGGPVDWGPIERDTSRRRLQVVQ